MNILFVTIIKINSINDRGVYPDLLRKFLNEGHKIYIVTPLERRYRQKSTLERQDNLVSLKIKTLNYQKTNIIEKWIGTLLINYLYLKGIKRYFSNIRFDLVLYSTPPITFNGLIEYIKKRNGAKSYLLLKDIFPQNAVDLGLIRERGLICKYYKRKEKLLYKVSDHIGCMSQANVDYILKNNPQIQHSKVEINPNSHELFDEQITPENKVLIKMKYNIPLNRVICIYGGNLGKPQGVDFIIEFLNSQAQNEDVFFLIVGSGTEYGRIKSWMEIRQPDNIKLISELPKHEYNMLLQSCDIGMIFLDKRFTVPNFPSRLLSYLEYKMPVLASTDKATDIGKTIMDHGFGLWSESGDISATDQNLARLVNDSGLRLQMGLNGFDYFLNNYTVSHSYDIIVNHFK